MAEEKTQIVQTATSAALLGAKDTAKMLGVSRTYLYGMHNCGRLGPLPIRFGKRILWNLKEVRQWVDAGCPPRHIWMKEWVDAGCPARHVWEKRQKDKNRK